MDDNSAIADHWGKGDVYALILSVLDDRRCRPGALAVRFTDSEGYFVSEASVYRLLKARDLIASPAFIVIKSRGRVHGQDDRTQPALADRLHLFQGDRLGVVLPLDAPR